MTILMRIKRLMRQLIMQKPEISTRGRKIKTENCEGLSKEVEAALRF